MPLSLPNLDTRRWVDLAEEGMALVPRYAPAWTDHNVTDPGVTVVELLAYLVEQDIYWLNRVPDSHRRKFLALAGDGPRPAQASQAVLAVPMPSGAGPLTLPAGTTWEADGRGLLFTSTATVTVVDAAVTPSAPVEVFGPEPSPGALFDLGFDPALPATDVTMWLGVSRPLAAPAGVEHYSVRTVWEAWDGSAWTPVPVIDATAAFTVDGFVTLLLPFSTHAVRCRFDSGAYDFAPSLRAVVLNAVPVEQAAPVRQAFRVAPAAAVSGAPAAPVSTLSALTLDDDGMVTGVGFSAPGGQGPQVEVVRWTAPSAAHEGRLEVDLAWVGRSFGWPGHVFELPDGGEPADGDVVVWTSGDWHRWDLRPDLDASGPGDRHAVLERGAIRFGDGRHGRVPPPGSDVFVQYRATAGRAGDVAAGAQFGGAAMPVPGWGGADPEGVGQAAGRVAADLWASERLVGLAKAAHASSLDQVPDVMARVQAAPKRATTLLDLERIALAVPGARVARCRAWAGLDVRFPCLRAPGTVSLVVIPELPRGRPVPSQDLLAAVRRHVDEARVIGTRLVVMGPTFVEVSVVARLVCRKGSDAARVQADVIAALNAFLDPLTGGGRGLGWPFGRDVYRSEVLEVVDGVAGVDHVAGLELRAGEGEAQCGNLCLGPGDLAMAGPHVVVVEGPR